MSEYRVEILIPATKDMDAIWVPIRNEPGDSFETARYWVRWFRGENDEYPAENAYRLIEITATVMDV